MRRLLPFSVGLAMYEDLNDRHGQAQTLNNVGAIYEGQGNDDEALSAYQRGAGDVY